MTSEERKEARYQRRVAARRKVKAERYADADRYEKVFCYGNLYNAYKCCRRNVAWKASVQKYITLAPLNVLQTYNRLMAGTYKTPGFFEFDLYERGKKRHIRSTAIGERVVQRCLCDNALVPMLSRSFIYDNGASMTGKGYDFAIRRLCQHLREHYRKYGQEGYILLFDFSKFFDRVSHELVKGILRKQFTDARLLKITEHFVDAFGGVGLGLGSQISQVLALASANRLDHYVKEVLRVRGYGRYMDDGYLIHPDKGYLQKCLEGTKAICAELKITLNLKKTQIVKLAHGFTWLKVRFFLTETGKVVRKIYRRSVTKMRQKLKSFHRKYVRGEMRLEDIIPSWISWLDYAGHFNAYRTVQSMATLCNQLFGREIITYAVY